MGSLVMSQAPSLQQHSYIMVDNDRHHDDEVNPASHPHRTSSSYSQSHEQSQRQSHTQQDTAPPSPPLRPADSSNRQSSSTENSHQYGFDQSGFPLSADPRGLHSSPSSPRLGPTYRSTRSLGGSEATSPSRLKVRDLAHIQSFASQEYMSRPRLGGRHFEAGRHYEISSMPVGDIIEMVAGLLTRITSTNDRQHEQANRPGTSQDSSASSHASCVLAFHGKNVPSISILSYLTRIHKYCPTTYEVFLSLLVYFDRMTDNFNKKFLESAIQSSRSDGSDSHASSDTLTEDNMHDIESSQSKEGQSEGSDPPQYFVVDSYNIHRLVIAGVTCASKFFSDVFYTNSRYAKVGGLPLAELNNLELQFLLLNDFRLSVPVEELEAYGTMLVEFYAREVVAQQQTAETSHHNLHPAPHGEEVYMSSRTTSQTTPVPV